MFYWSVSFDHIFALPNIWSSHHREFSWRHFICFSIVLNDCTVCSGKPLEARWNEALVTWLMLFLEQNLANCSLVKEDALSETIVSWTPWVAKMWCRSSIVDSDEAVWVIATLMHSESAFTKYILHSTKKGASIVYVQPRLRGLGVFPRMQMCFGEQNRQNKIEPFFQDEHQCLATKPNYGPVPSLKWFLGGCHVTLSWLFHASVVGLVTIQSHRINPSSTLTSSFLLKNGNNSAVHVLIKPPYRNTVANLGHIWVSASSFLYLLGINISFISSFHEVLNVFRDGCVFWCIRQWHPTKAICMAIFLVLDLWLRVKLYA